MKTYLTLRETYVQFSNVQNLTLNFSVIDHCYIAKETRKE